MKQNIWNTYTGEQMKELKVITDRYMSCLDAGKTERECVELGIRMAKEAGYRDLKEVLAAGASLRAGDKVYAVNMEKMLALFRIGEEPLSAGMNILGAHIDSPRIDLKQQTLYETEGLAYFDTHYYGGVKKYQWLAQPLAIHGVVVKENGEKVEIVIGEDPEDPVLVITDLLPHLDKPIRKKTADEFVDAENMDLLIGNRAKKGEEKDAVKGYIQDLLKEKYGIEEEDFISAELEIVPAGKARECGLDRSMILAYGQDDRVCAFTSLMAMLEVEEPERTSCCILIDKEEIGSVGASGMTSRFFENMVAEIVALLGDYNELTVRRALSSSKMLSSDVSAAFDPMFAEVYEKRNSAMLACGPVFNKYTGHGGKSGSNDANPEYVAQLRRVMRENQVRFQTAELGRIDVGGGVRSLERIEELAELGCKRIAIGTPIVRDPEFARQAAAEFGVKDFRFVNEIVRIIAGDLTAADSLGQGVKRRVAFFFVDEVIVFRQAAGQRSVIPVENHAPGIEAEHGDLILRNRGGGKVRRAENLNIGQAQGESGEQNRENYGREPEPFDVIFCHKKPPVLVLHRRQKICRLRPRANSAENRAAGSA